jgi:hypothetical protein
MEQLLLEIYKSGSRSRHIETLRQRLNPDATLARQPFIKPLHEKNLFQPFLAGDVKSRT